MPLSLPRCASTCVAFLAILGGTTFAQDAATDSVASSTQSTAPPSQTSVGGVKLVTPTDISTCGKLPITWTFTDPGAVTDENAYITRVAIWVTDLYVDQTPSGGTVSTTNASPATPSSQSVEIPSTNDQFIPPLETVSPTIAVPFPTTSNFRRALRFPVPHDAHRKRLVINPLNITITSSHPLLGYANLTWNPTFLPPNHFYQLWMQSVEPASSSSPGLQIYTYTDRFWVSASDDQSCLTMPLTQTSSAPGSLNTSDDGSPSKGLHGGSIAGVVVGALVGVAAIALLLLFCMRKRKQKKAMASEKGIIPGDRPGSAAGGFVAGLTQRRRKRRHPHHKDSDDMYAAAHHKSQRHKKRTFGMGSKDSAAPVLNYQDHGRSPSDETPPSSGSVDSVTMEGTLDGDHKKGSTSRQGSTNESHYHPNRGRRSNSVGTATLPGSLGATTLGAPYYSVDSRDGILANVDSPIFTTRRASMRSNRSASAGAAHGFGMGGGRLGHDAEEAYQMSPVETWAASPLSAKRERAPSLPGGAAPPVTPSTTEGHYFPSRMTSPIPSPLHPSSRVTSPGPYAQSNHTNTTLHNKTPTKRKPAPAYPAGVRAPTPVSSPPLPSPHQASGPQVYSAPARGRSSSSLGGGGAVSPTHGPGGKATPLGVKRASSLGMGATPPSGDAFSGFAGVKEGPVHYLMPDMPPSSSEGHRT